MTAFLVIRVIVGAASLLLFVIGLLILTAGGPGAVAGLGPMVMGGIGLIAIALERQRYRSLATEKGGEAVGPGGGEPADAALPARFQPTEERFVDPTTKRDMRVFVDPSTGERRYRAE